MRKKTRGKRFSFRKPFRSLLIALGRTLRAILSVAPVVCIFFLVIHGVKGYLFADVLFSLSEFRVETDGILSQGEVARIGGIRLGDNVLALNLREATRRLEADRRIKQAVLMRVLPNELVAVIQERREFVRTRMAPAGTPVVMDEEGFLLGPAVEGNHLALLQDLRPQARLLFRGERYQDPRLLRIVFALKEKAEKEPLLGGQKVIQVDVHSSSRIDVVLEGGLEIRMAEAFERDWQKLDALRPYLAKAVGDLEYIDLRFQNVVAKRKK